MNIYTTIFNIGAKPSDSARLIKKINLINGFGLLATVSTFLFLFHLLLIRDYNYIPIQFITVMALSCFVLFSKYRFFYGAFYWVFIITVANIFYRSIEFPNAGIEYFLIPASLIVVLIIEKINTGALLIFFALLAFWLSYYLNGIYTPKFVISGYHTRLTFILVLNAVILLCVLILYQFKLINGSYEQIIEQQKNKLKHKNEEITDSINYAKRIQQAKLPNMAVLSSVLPNSFVLFKPKDIVSGDFYFFKQKENLLFIAAADCTGHGVPGAFMSIVCLEQLDIALSQFNSVSTILSSTNKGVKASLNQTDTNESTRDGMDIAICCLNTSTNTLHYAGANRPVWIIRNNSLIVDEQKATKAAIGGLTDSEQVFNEHEFKLKKGDSFYLFSDGYADTFNGITDKKLTTKAFRKLLVSIQQHTMAEQHTIINEYIEAWKHATEQVDDILVIGMRL